MCHSLRPFVFRFHDVSYTAHNGADDLTDGTLAAFAEACPNLTKVQLQGTSGLGDEMFIAFFQHCPNLSYLEITGMGYSKITGRGFDAVCQNPGWGCS